jgi:chitinase
MSFLRINYNILQPRILVLLLLIGITAIIIRKQFYLFKKYQSCDRCPTSAPCCSRWGFCGSTTEYCGFGCQSGPCIYNNNGNEGNNNDRHVITKAIFRCAFPSLNAELLAQRLQGFKETQWSPVNKDEAAIFLSHVSHETDGLQTYVEYCQRTNCKFVSLNC